MRLLSSLILFLTISLLHGQGRTRTLETDSGRVVLHYFTTGQLSTKEWTDKEGRWGRSWAYKRDGVVLMDQHTRRIAGHASVHFEYHPNGAISTAEYSDAPDAGIQWYRSTTTFDADGNRTGFTEQGHDDDGWILRPDLMMKTQPIVEQPQVQQVVECQKLFVNEVLVVNSTRETAVIRCTPKRPSPALPEGEHLLSGTDTLRLGSYSVGERFEGPEGHLDLTVVEAMFLNQVPRIAIVRAHYKDLSKEHRAHTIEIIGWTLGPMDTVNPSKGPVEPQQKEPVRRWWKFWR